MQTKHNMTVVLKTRKALAVSQWPRAMENRWATTGAELLEISNEIVYNTVFIQFPYGRMMFNMFYVLRFPTTLFIVAIDCDCPRSSIHVRRCLRPAWYEIG
jgi:hypothetical protein